MGLSAPIDLVAEIRRRKQPARQSQSPASPRDRAERDSAFAMGRSSEYRLAGGLGLKEPDNPDDVLDALSTQAPEPTQRAAGEPPQDPKPGDWSTGHEEDDAIGEQLRHHHERALNQPAVIDAPRGSAQLAAPPLKRRAAGQPRRAARRSATRAPARRRRRAAIAVGGALAAMAIALGVVVALGALGGHRHASAATHATGRPLVSFATLRSDVQTGIRQIGMAVRRESQLARARAVARTLRGEATEAEKHIRHRKHEYLVELEKRRAASTPPQSTQSHESTDTDTTPDVVETSPSATDATAQTSEPSTSDTGSSSAASDSSSGSAPAGPTGVGGSTGGCNPQCR